MSTTGTKLTINIRDLGIPFEAGKSYRIDIDEGLTKEVGNNRSPSQPRPNFQTFDTITQAVIVSTNPVAGALAFVDPANTSITFDRVVYKDAGNLYLYKGDNTLLRTIPVGNADIILSTSTATVGLNLLGDINRSTDYYITFDGSSFNDNWFINATTVTNTSTFYFKTGLGPVVSSVSPAFNTTGSYVTTASLTFNRTISINPTSKNFYVYRKDQSGDTLISTISNSDSKVSISGTNTVKLNLSQIVDSDRTYYITAQPAVILGSNLFDSEEFSDENTFKYSTGIGATVINTTPANLVTNTNTSSFSLTYNRGIITKNSGNYYLYKKGVTDELISTIPVSSVTVTTGTTSSTVLINLKTVVHGSSTYYITADYGILKDDIYFSSKEVNSSTTYTFTTRPGPRVSSAWTSSTSFLPYFVFDDIIYKNTGSNTVSLYDITSTPSLVTTIPMTSSSVFTSATNRLYVNLFELIDGERSYYVVGDNGIVRSVYNGFNNEIISSTSTMRFSTAAKPIAWRNIPYTVVDNDPLDYQGFPPSFTATISLTRSPFVKKTGNFYFYRTTSTTLDLVLPITSTTFTGTDILLPIKGSLQNGTQYYVVSDSNMVLDTSGFKWVGISSTSSWRFFTGNDYVQTNYYQGTQTGTNITYNFGIQIQLKDNFLAVLQKQDSYTTNGSVSILTANGGSLLRTITSSTSAGGFGQAISANSNQIAVSDFKDSTTGKVFIYNTSTGNVVNVFTNTNSSNGDLFGFSLSMTENHLIAGCPNNDTGASNAGSAYIYSLTSSTLKYAIFNPDPYAGSQFGYSVAMNDNYAVIGAPNYPASPSSSYDNTGRAYVYSVTSGTLVYTLSNPNIFASVRSDKDRYGNTVAINNDYIFVAAVGEKNGGGLYGCGVVYVYSILTGNLVYTFAMPGQTYPEMYNADQNGSANPTDNILNPNFGHTISVTNDHLIVGTYTAVFDSPTTAQDGTYRVYIYRLSDGLLVASPFLGEKFQDPNLYAGFGNAVSINSNKFAVGSQFQYKSGLNWTAPGGVYMFNLIL
jgi:hypothetical protein